MANRSRDSTTADSSQVRRRERLRRASAHLATMLQSLDLEDEPQLADEVIEALQATDRAYELEKRTGDNA